MYIDKVVDLFPLISIYGHYGSHWCKYKEDYWEREYLKIIFGIIFPKKIKLYIDEVVDLSPFISSYGTLVTMEVFDLNIRNTIENGNT